jgi:hypothetical protein
MNLTRASPQARLLFGTTAAPRRQVKLSAPARHMAPRQIIADFVDKAGEARYGG